jgi:hypothetical protein
MMTTHSHSGSDVLSKSVDMKLRSWGYCFDKSIISLGQSELRWFVSRRSDRKCRRLVGVSQHVVLGLLLSWRKLLKWFSKE